MKTTISKKIPCQNDPLYLSAQVGADPEMTPRELVGKSPRALVVDVALTVPDGAITQEKLADNVLPFTLSALDTSYVVVEERQIVEISSWDFGNVPGGTLNVRVDAKNPAESGTAITFGASNGIDQRYGRQLTGIAGLRH